ncbi:MAG TPA: TIR domain-containing protein [Thermoanaerobaculia bacterium]|jgi:tetratricopeptide (TPR) repeat protein|nr:TIR domain-containing protein [Thermoanaerobaculia bacterium]
MSGAPRLYLGRLPIAGPLLIGRETELARLDAAWESTETHVLTFVAFGGMGKSALVSHWLDHMAAAGWRGARRVLEWSFYSQGTKDRISSADRFLDLALGWFGDPDPKAGAARDRGLRLAELVRQEKTLLVLDGVEPLQHPPTSSQAGQLKDSALAALLKGLAGDNPGLCLVTTRERITDLDRFPKTAPQKNLEALSPEAGAELLRKLGVQGRESELRAASEEFGSHALTLTLLGTYLKDICNGDVRRRHEVPILEEEADETGHARRVIASYAKALEPPEVEVLRLLGLFDRPAEPARLKALRAEPPIVGLTETIGISQEARFRKAVARLRKARLVAEGEEDLDAHPLVRVFFQEELEKQRPEAWRAGNLRLYEHLQKEVPDLPDTLEDMELLYTAVIHGCRADRQQEALREVYYRRVRPGNKIGAFGLNLSALSGFFDRPWDQPSASLTPAAQAFLLNEAGLSLRALGRVTEAVQPMEGGLGMVVAREDWKNASIQACNLSELTLTLGEVERAVAFGKESIDLADRSQDVLELLVTRASLADALHQAGRWDESAEVFREAETLQEEDHPQYPRLYSVPGYRYCDLLLSSGEPEDGSVADGLVTDPEAAQRFRDACREVRERAEQTLGWVINTLPFLDIAVDHLSLGRAHFGLALTTSLPAAPDQRAEADFAKAAEHLDHAVEGLQRAGAEHHLPRALLARAAFRRLRSQPTAAAEEDLSEALEIAERGSMRLHECDAHLEWARLCRQQGDRNGMEQHAARARKLVEETGYERRRREVVYLEKRLTEMPREEPMKDFFVSFTKADRAWADWIAWTLEEAGHEVVYQPWDFLPGNNFVLKMQEAASGTRKTVIVLSDSYLNATFTQPEWAAAFAEDPRGDQRKLIAFRVAPCSPPGLLKPLIYADLVGLPLDEAKAAVLRGVSDEPRAKPTVAPAFPGTAAAPAPPSFPGVSPAAAANPGSGALAIWKEKLEFLLKAEATASDPAQQFTLQQQIKEARAKIQELGG